MKIIEDYNDMDNYMNKQTTIYITLEERTEKEKRLSDRLNRWIIISNISTTRTIIVLNVFHPAVNCTSNNSKDDDDDDFSK